MKTRQSLRRILTLAWLVPAFISLLLSLGAFFIVGFSDYHNAIQRETSALNTQTQIIARRLAAEVLIGARGSVGSVSDLLKSEFALADIQINKDPSLCRSEEIRTDGFCVKRAAQALTVIRQLPLVQDPTFIQVSKRSPSYWNSLNPVVLLWSVLPILFILGLGIIGVRWLLERYVLDPVEQLTDSAYRGTETPQYWPIELAELSTELRQAFTRRDLAMVGQMASGVIHDLKTLLHSAWSAAQLAEEQPIGSEKRQQRLEAFLRAGLTNFPKMQVLIETTLDGSREIRVKPTPSDITSTLDQALRATGDLALRSKVTFDVESSEEMQAVSHDSSQLERAFTNLIKNAIEATTQNGKASGRVSVRASRDAIVGTKIVIEDDGPGLGSEPNQVLTSVQSTKIHGSGLGLVISRKIIEAHFGSLTAGKSETLGGARFEIVLPEEGARG